MPSSKTIGAIASGVIDINNNILTIKKALSLMPSNKLPKKVEDLSFRASMPSIKSVAKQQEERRAVATPPYILNTGIKQIMPTALKAVKKLVMPNLAHLFILSPTLSHDKIYCSTLPYFCKF